MSAMVSMPHSPASLSPSPSSPSYAAGSRSPSGLPLAPQRPSVLRTNSSSILVPAVTRFSPQTTYHNSPSILSTTESSFSPLPPPMSLSALPPPATRSCSFEKHHNSTTPPIRPPVQPVIRSNSTKTNSNSSSTGSSLLARRRSSAGAQARGARPDFSLTSLSDLTIPDLPIPPLEELDDTIPKTIIGESSAAVTPVSEAGTPGEVGGVKTVVERSFKPTKTLVSTPYPEKKAYLSEDDEDEDEDEEREHEQEESSDEEDEADTSVRTLW